MVSRFAVLISAIAAMSAAVPPTASKPIMPVSADLSFNVGDGGGQATNGSAAQGVAAHQIEQAPDGLFYVQGKVGMAQIHFIVDSGANVVVLTPSDAARIGLRANRGHTSDMQTTGGVAHAQMASLKEIIIAGQTIKDVDAVVVRSDIKTSLLGQSALSRLRSVSFEGHHLRLN